MSQNETTRDRVWTTLLNSSGIVTLEELAKASNVTRKTAAEVMHKAESEGFVEYERMNPLKVKVIA